MRHKVFDEMKISEVLKGMKIQHFNYYIMFLVILFLCAQCGNSGEQKLNEAAGEIDSIAESEDRAPEKKIDMQASGKITFVELGSVNCIPCKKMQPIMADIEREYADQVTVVFHDVWTSEGRPYAEKYGIKLIPTQVFLDKNGVEYFRHEGFFPKNELVKILNMRGVN